MLGLSTLIMLIGLAHCSLVEDILSQKGVYVSEYCPKMEHCAEGAHVMCMYYNPNQIMGPRCSNPKNLTMTSDMAEKLLEIVNAVRSRIALGKEKGKGGVLLPRGFGMFRLKWDNELATFAQVLANQCMLRHDMCRASKKFPDPGQTAGLVRFSYPGWYSISKNANTSGLNYEGLTKNKIMHAITQTLKSWYVNKAAVTADMINHYPDWTENPTEQHGRLYLEMVYGPTTHMGCGISAYTEYAYYDNGAALNYNSVQVVCNYSKRSHKGGQVYQVDPPNIAGYTVKCGCPEGYDEDADCLCCESPKVAEEYEETCVSQDHNCKPTVVLLPIFTVEEAPPEKLAFGTGLEIAKKEPQIETMDLYGINNDTMIQALTKLNAQQKESIFLKTSSFELPNAGIVKTDIQPRKDFSKVKIHSNDYLKRQNGDLTKVQKRVESLKSSTDLFSKNNSSDFEDTKTSHDKIMSLLDKLEQEVKHIELDKNKREIFDAKIRKIYGTVVGKPNLLLRRNELTSFELNDSDNKYSDIENVREKKFRHHIDDDSKLDNTFKSKRGKERDNRENEIKHTVENQKDIIDVLRDEPNKDNGMDSDDDIEYLFHDKSKLSSHKFNNKTDSKLRNVHNIKETLRSKHIFAEAEEKRRIKDAARRLYYASFNDNEKDPLGPARRRYYQEKIDKIKRKHHNSRKLNHNDFSIIRPVIRPIRVKPQATKSQLEQFYMPDRARFLHGFR